MAYRSRAHRDIPHTRRPRARHPGREKGECDSLGLKVESLALQTKMCENAERNESRPAPKSGAHAPRAHHLPHCTLAPPRSQPIHLAECRGAAESRDLGRSRTAPRDLGRSRAISGRHATPPPPPTHRRAALSRAISERRSRGGTPAQKGRARLEPRGSRARSVRRLTLPHF